jgi:hypothetical protein
MCSPKLRQSWCFPIGCNADNGAQDTLCISALSHCRRKGLERGYRKATGSFGGATEGASDNPCHSLYKTVGSMREHGQKTDNLRIKEKREIFGVPHVLRNLLISCLAEKGGSRTLRGPYDPQTGFEDQRHHRAPSFSSNNFNYLWRATLFCLSICLSISNPLPKALATSAGLRSMYRLCI